jgi:hypothetical protein
MGFYLKAASIGADPAVLEGTPAEDGLVRVTGPAEHHLCGSKVAPLYLHPLADNAGPARMIEHAEFQVLRASLLPKSAVAAAAPAPTPAPAAAAIPAEPTTIKPS